MVPFCSVPFCPTVHFAPTYHVPFCPWDYVWGKRIMWTIISPVAQSNDLKMQRFYYLICQSNWCQNASKFEISFLWDKQNVVYCKFDFGVWRWTRRWQKSNGRENRPTPDMHFSKHSVFHFAPMFLFAPTYYNSTLMSRKIVIGRYKKNNRRTSKYT